MANLTYILITGALLVALLLCSGVVPFWMPDMIEMIALLCAVVLMVIWVGFVMLEKKGDERDTLHRMYAGRSAYLSCVAVLTIALLVQGLAHAIDPWIPATLAVMLGVKLGARLYVSRHQ